jgi:hypothetical protein
MNASTTGHNTLGHRTRMQRVLNSVQATQDMPRGCWLEALHV